MKLLKYYFLAGSKSDFITQFQNNDQLYAQANSFWQQLEAYSWVFPVICIVLGIGVAAFYYKPYNEWPNRHYKPLHWFLFMALTFVLTFLITWGFEYYSVRPRLNGANWLEIKIAICNALYSVVIYLGTSFVWCKWLNTNAYRLLKI